MNELLIQHRLWFLRKPSLDLLIHINSICLAVWTIFLSNSWYLITSVKLSPIKIPIKIKNRSFFQVFLNPFECILVLGCLSSWSKFNSPRFFHLQHSRQVLAYQYLFPRHEKKDRELSTYYPWNNTSIPSISFQLINSETQHFTYKSPNKISWSWSISFYAVPASCNSKTICVEEQ